MKDLTDTLNQLNDSPTLAITAKAKALIKDGHDVVLFSSGEPDFDAPASISEAAKERLDRGGNGYTAAAGLPELRDAVKERFERKNSLQYASEEITVTSGAKQALFNAIRTLCNPGDEVIVIAPYWVSYPEMVTLCGAKARVVHAKKASHYLPEAADLEAAISENTKAIIVNTPNNPTGVIYPEKTLRMIRDIAVRHDLYIISDEIYDTLIYEGTHHSLASFDARERTITINGMSKAYAMTGWRIGFAGGPGPVIQAMNKIQAHTTSNANTIAQHASIVGLKQCDDLVASMRDTFKARRDLMVKQLNAIEAIHVPTPEGAFYVMVDISPLLGRRYHNQSIDDAITFAKRLLEDAHVASVPGEAFGAPGTLRLSYATDDASINKGVKRFKTFVEALD